MPVALFPAPRSLATAPGGPGPDARVTAVSDPELPPQGYRLHTGPEGIRLAHRDAAGLRYALQTLDQLRASADFADTAYTVADHPDFTVRGFLLDISRDRVPTRRTLLRWIEVLAAARFNHLELYCEHTFAHPGHEQVWRDASPLTAEDLRWLDDRCAEAGIELAAHQNTFGHMERFLAHPEYAERAENPEGFQRGGVRYGPSTLAPTADNAAFAAGLAAGAAAHLRSDRLHIGADEPFELGTGRSREDVARDGLGRVHFEHLMALARPLIDAGSTVLFWGDVLDTAPGLVHLVPAGAIPVVWQYDSPHSAAAVLDADGEEARSWRAAGTDVEALRAGFRSRTAGPAAAGIPFWVAPGTGTWNSVLGRRANARQNMLDAAEAGRADGAAGYLLTCWGDNGAWEPPAIAFGPALYGGAVSWCAESNRDTDTAEVLDTRVFHDAARVAGPVLERLAGVGESLGVPLLNATPPARLLQPDAAGAEPVWSDPAPLEAAAAELERCRRALATADLACADGDVVLREVLQAIGLADFAVQLAQARTAAEAGTDGIDPADAGRLLRLLDLLVAEQRACWLLRARSGGLDDSAARFTGLRRRLVAAAHR